jgi:hypothetical protein
MGASLKPDRLGLAEPNVFQHNTPKVQFSLVPFRTLGDGHKNITFLFSSVGTKAILFASFNVEPKFSP